jgi:hypothetical protein
MAKNTKTDTEQQPKTDIETVSAGDGIATAEGTIEAMQDVVVADLHAHIAELEEQNAKLMLERGELRKLQEKASKLKLGQTLVLEASDATELVLVHRKRSLAPTGRYVPKHVLRFQFTPDQREALATLEREGAIIVTGANLAADGEPPVVSRIATIKPHFGPLDKGKPAPAFSLPAEMVQDALAKGWLEEEVA